MGSDPQSLIRRPELAPRGCSRWYGAALRPTGTSVEQADTYPHQVVVEEKHRRVVLQKSGPGQQHAVQASHVMKAKLVVVFRQLLEVLIGRHTNGNTLKFQHQIRIGRKIRVLRGDVCRQVPVAGDGPDDRFDDLRIALEA